MSNRMFLTLPSNSSLLYYPENTLANFKTHLLNKIQLGHGGDWEIGLAEIQYPRNWLTISAKDQDDYIMVSCPRAPLPERIKGLEGTRIEPFHCIPDARGPYPKEIVFPKGHYRSITDILQVLNRKVQKVAQFGWIPFENYVRVMIKKNRTLFLSNTLAKLLGLRKRLIGKKEEEVIYTGENISPFPPEIKNMYVYCNLAQDRVVGDVEAPLLRIIPVTGHYQEFVTHICEDVHFVPAKGGENSMVEIDIRDDLGDPIPFQEGKLVVVLELRKKRPFIY